MARRRLPTPTTSSPVFRRRPARGVALFPLFLGLEAKSLGWDWLLSIAQYPLFCAFVLVGTAFLLVSTLPVWSFKNFKVPHEYVLPLLLGAVTFAAVLVADPWAALAAGGLIYLGDAAVQRAQLPPTEARGRGDAGSGSSVTTHGRARMP